MRVVCLEVCFCVRALCFFFIYSVAANHNNNNNNNNKKNKKVGRGCRREKRWKQHLRISRQLSVFFSNFFFGMPLLSLSLKRTASTPPPSRVCLLFGPFSKISPLPVLFLCLCFFGGFSLLCVNETHLLNNQYEWRKISSSPR